LVLIQNSKMRFLKRKENEDFWIELRVKDELDFKEDCLSWDDDGRKVVWIALAIFYKEKQWRDNDCM
jgi:hypothetical protein